ncbi:MAG: nicotinate-nucleotide adenylyltransferase [Herpetosiphonaceae bacterium]|nr:nicotinate-nucleotide adenylyltransferase [Herpetosiphonaceae bacterium]
MHALGLLGGTFDPIHQGHLAIAADVGWSLQLERILFIPTGHQPLKAGGHCASALDRLAMTAHAIADNPQFELCDWEVRREGPSYTVDTVAALRTKYPDTRLWFIIGTDGLLTLPRWHRVAELVQMCSFAVVQRPGYHFDPQRLDPVLRPFDFQLITGPALDISASELRERVERGAPVRYFLPAAVHSYIEQHNLYRDCL